MKIASWNVNSLRVRLPQVLDWLVEHKPDVLALQETKIPDDEFPEQAIKEAGYHVLWSGQKTYNGVALICQQAPQGEMITNFTDFADQQKRLLAVSINDWHIVNLYVPNGAAVGSDKYHYKLQWLTQLIQFTKAQLKAFDKVILLGDFNIAPQDIDVHDPSAWEGHVLVSEPERDALQALLDLGMQDVFRMLNQTQQVYSWWDYRGGAFWRNHGCRIDLIISNDALAGCCKECYIDKAPRKNKRPSDHAPVVAVFET